MSKTDKVLNHLYQKYIVEQDDAYYYGCGQAVEDLEKLFKVMKFKPAKGKVKNA